jgi:hypothetical protein
VSEDPASIAQRLLGTWRLVEWSEINPDGTKSYPLGEKAIGQIIYSTDGHVAAQLVAVDRRKFGSDDWREASSEEGSRAFNEYFGYFGTYTIDMSRKAVVHHVKGAWFPNVEGVDQVRAFHFEGSHLVLDADTKWGKVRIVWARGQEPAS